MWDIAETVLREECKALKAYVRKNEKPQGHNLGFHIKSKQNQNKLKKAEGIIKIRAEINEIENKSKR